MVDWGVMLSDFHIIIMAKRIHNNDIYSTYNCIYTTFLVNESHSEYDCRDMESEFKTITSVQKECTSDWYFLQSVLHPSLSLNTKIH